MAAGEFKAKCLAVMDEVKATGEPVVITKRGKVVAQLGPPDNSVHSTVSVDSIFGALRGMVTITSDTGDLVGPIIPLEAWDHLKDDWSPFPPE
jgi:antitoxin (DNA-binding transcriptional repressor) of toxin-antitoxin stability system